MSSATFIRFIPVLMAIFLLSPISLAGEDLKYGSKVEAHDIDESDSLCRFYIEPEIAYVDANIIGIFDPSDPVYINIDPSDGEVSENDVRVTPFKEIPAGSQVGIGDPDHGYRLSRFGSQGVPFAELRYFDVDGDMAYSLDDPVYLDVTPGIVDAGDIRITGYLGYEAGGRVRNAQADSDKETAILPARLAFFNANGNINNGGFGMYDEGDTVYLDTQYPFNVITINDVRLTA